MKRAKLIEYWKAEPVVKVARRFDPASISRAIGYNLGKKNHADR
ncbi:MAG TPA: hypothetical protein VIG62_21480 [Blastocatellia bacterium]|jgi:hypothetical protein